MEAQPRLLISRAYIRLGMCAPRELILRNPRRQIRASQEYRDMCRVSCPSPVRLPCFPTGHCLGIDRKVDGLLITPNS